MIASWGISHITSSPHYARSNGLAERGVRHVKAVVKKTVRKGDVHQALLNLRATPVDAKLPSPAEMLLGRPIATLLLSHSKPGAVEHRVRLEERNVEMKRHHDLTSRQSDLPPLYKGQEVRILDRVNKTWCPGTVVEQCSEPRSYLVKTPNGTQVRRNRSHLRELTSSKPRVVRFSDEPSHEDLPETQPMILTPAQDHCQQADMPQPRQTRQDVTGCRTRSGRVVKAPMRYQ